jgi:hypothetical protein
VPNRDEHILEVDARRGVGVRVPGHDRAQAERLRELAEGRVAAGVAARERPLQLDEEPLRPERPCQAGRTVRVAHCEPHPRAAGEADEPLVALLEERLVEPRLEAAPGVRGGQEPAEVGVAFRRLDEERHVRAAPERHLGPGDRTDAELLRGVGELERAVQPVVVGERERLVAVLRGREHQLLWPRGAVQERVGAVAVELDVPAHGARRFSTVAAWPSRRSSPTTAAS